MSIARTLRVTVCTAMMTLVACAAPANAGEDPGHRTGKVKVTPKSVRPGEEIDLRVDACDSPEGAIAKSRAFYRSVPLKPAADGGLFGEATVADSTRPGDYWITVDCDGDTGVAKGRVTVVGGKPTHHQPTHQPTHKPTHHKPTHHQPTHPSAPVRAGGGGMAGQDGSGVPNSLELGLGGAGVLGLAVAALLRRRTAARHGGGN